MEYLFFFSSRRRHTRWPRDWSSDVCSSDLHQIPLKMVHSGGVAPNNEEFGEVRPNLRTPVRTWGSTWLELRPKERRSEERRVGKEGRARWSREPEMIQEM